MKDKNKRKRVAKKRVAAVKRRIDRCMKQPTEKTDSNGEWFAI